MYQRKEMIFMNRDIFKPLKEHIIKMEKQETKCFLLLFVSEIEDKVSIESDCNYQMKGYGSRKLFLSLPLELSKSQMTRHWFADFYYQTIETECSKKNQGGMWGWKQFFIFCLKNSFYSGDFDAFIDGMEKWKNHNAYKETLIFVLETPKDMAYFRYAKVNCNKGDFVTPIEFDTKNKFIQELLVDFFEQTPEFIVEYKSFVFFKEFSTSLNHKLPKDVLEFNVNTLRQQCLYFKSSGTDTIRFLKNFYIYLDKLQGDKSVFIIAHNVNIAFLQRKDFLALFLNDYKLVQFNRYEDPPDFDRWVVLPNGEEKRSTTVRKNKYRTIFFDDISFEFKSICKKFFWYGKSDFRTKFTYMFIIKDFLIFRTDFRNNKKIILFQQKDFMDTICANDIKYYLHGKEKNKNGIKKALTTFLQYIQKNNLYKVHESCYRFLKINEYSSDNIPMIPSKDYCKLIDKLIEHANLSKKTLDELCLIIFIIMSLTPFRVNQLMGLSINNLKVIGKDKYAIETITKTSKGNKKIFEITGYIRKLFMNAIDLTDEYRNIADEEIQNYIFLRSKKSVLAVYVFDLYLKKVCMEIGIQVYGAQNIRKTYMTVVAKNALKDGACLSTLKDLFDHASISTTQKYYLKLKTSDYLSSIGSLNIRDDDIPVMGQILPDEKLSSKDSVSLVNKGCGHCTSSSCQIISIAECVMCSHFSTTPKHIPFFEKEIERIGNILEDDSLSEHDRKDYELIQKLYLKYIKSLIKVKGVL